MTNIPIKLSICGRDDLQKLFQNNKYDAIISINDPDKAHKWDLYRRDKWKKWLEENGCSFTKPDKSTTICLYFDDATPGDRSLFGNHTLRLPLPIHIEQIVNLSNNIKDNNVDNKDFHILIHCRMGISRSTAAAMIVLMEHGLSEEDALATVKNVRPIACPNTHMLDLYRQRNNSG
uniref:Tyrosine specific protein phosphatases domain-containing protein n=1 Tax=viral metagenome TaxID=1070528 RepID=A0A6C0JTG2_9ZZZZ